MPDEEYWKDFKRKTLASLRKQYPDKKPAELNHILFGILYKAGWRPKSQGGPLRG